MKYSVFFVFLTTFAPSSWAQSTKPNFICDNTGVAPECLLGGYDVPLANYGNGKFRKANGLKMVEDLWRKTFFHIYDTDIHPSRNFNPDTATPLHDEKWFDFDKKNGHYRGVGVRGGRDSEIEADEGLYVYFGGMCVRELWFGARALFKEDKRPTWMSINEAGLVNIYKNKVRLNASFEFATNGNDRDDGQEFFHMKAEHEFDAISFITHSHSSHVNPVRGHDYFLEYIDLCCIDPRQAAHAQIAGDPHIKTWSGIMYDFHGICDLVLLQNPDFEKGLGMDIHIRTKQIKEFSYVSSAVLRIGDDTLEVMGGIGRYFCWINKEPIGNPEEGIVDEIIGGYPVSFQKLNSKQYEFRVNLAGEKSIVFKTFKKFVHVSINGANEEDFGTSLGLLGSYGSGKTIARDNTTVIEDENMFGQEWQVLPHEKMLFHNVEGPQAPAMCDIPTASNLRRRLEESMIGQEEAEIACAGVVANLDDFSMCVFDVIATGDMDTAGAY